MLAKAVQSPDTAVNKNSQRWQEKVPHKEFAGSDADLENIRKKKVTV